MRQVYLDKKLLDKIEIVDSSWFLYGDSVFTSCAVLNGKITWFNDHVQRLKISINDYYFQNALSNNDLTLLEENIYSIQEFTQNIESGYVRITFFPNENLAFAATLKNISQLSCLWHIENIERTMDQKACTLLDLGNISYPSHLKLGSYGIEHYWKRKIKKNNFDDYIRISNKKVFEASTSNVFFYLKDKSFVTPKIVNGVLNGICRKNLIKFLKSIGHKIIEKDVTIDILKESREVFLTNSVLGITPINQLDQHQFETKMARSLRSCWPWEN